MAQELSASIPLLKTNMFGRFIAQTLELPTFKRSKEEWKILLKNQEKQKILAKDFLSDLCSPNGKTVGKEGPNAQPITKKMKVAVNEGHAQFVIDKVGDKINDHDNTNQFPDNAEIEMPKEQKKKKKKDKAKSYLDDL